MSRHELKSKNKMTLWLCTGLAGLTLAVGALAVMVSDGFSGSTFLGKSASSHAASSVQAVLPPIENAVASSESSVEMPPLESVEFRKPDEMRAVTLTPGVDYPLDGDLETLRAGIDRSIHAAVELTMNTVVLETVADGKAVYPSTMFPCATFPEEFNPIAYAADQARAAGLYVYGIFHLTDCNWNGNPLPQKATPPTRQLDAVAKDASGFASACHPDGILLDGYYNVLGGDSYASYLREGGAIGYETYERALPRAWLSVAKKSIQAAVPSTQVGLLSESVWANAADQEGGSKTKGEFSIGMDGNVDTPALLQEGFADFLTVKAFGSLDDPALPYQAVTSWWSNQATQNGLPLYILHAADRAVSNAIGWSEYDQLARQVILGREQPGYSGSIFNSLSRLQENPKDCAGKLVGYYQGSVKPEHILTNLELTAPQKTTFTSFDPTVLFAGNTDPNTDATINGVKIVTDANGYFSLEMDLKEGENTFQIVHKGKTVTYRITRVIEVVREVTPTGVITADGGTKLSIGAVAYGEAKVYAVVNGKTIAMAPVEDKEDNSLRDTAYRRFAGVYTVPDATTSIQDLGAITVYGEWSGYKKSKVGATLKVNARALPSDGKPVVITADWAETFPSSTLSQYSDPTYFPLPKGSLDYAIGSEIKYTFMNDKGVMTTYLFYKLQSGLRVFSDDIAGVSTNQAPVGNRITGCTVTADERYTKIILATQQKVAFTTRYSPDAITVQFHYTDSLPDGMTLTQNPLFSSVSFRGDTMTLTLREKGVFMGLRSDFDSNGNLVLRCNNPPSDIAQAKIVIDPGHGGNDPGAMGYLASHPEKVVNYAIANQLASILNSWGASAVLINNNANPSLEQRVQTAIAQNPHLFISVHSNSQPYKRDAAGSEAYYFNQFSYAFSQYAATNAASALETANRGGKFGYYYVTRDMQYPSILVETGFLSNQNEYSKLVNEEYQKRVASGLANAINSYFKLMCKHAGMVGTQTSGSSALADAGPPPSTAASSSTPPIKEKEDSDSNGKESKEKLHISDTKLTLAVDDVASLSAWLDETQDYQIIWSVEGDSSAVEISQSSDDSGEIELVALNPGKVTILARVKGNNAKSASCVIKVGQE